MSRKFIKCVCSALILDNGVQICPRCGYPDLQARKVGFKKYDDVPVKEERPRRRIVDACSLRSGGS